MLLSFPIRPDTHHGHLFTAEDGTFFLELLYALFHLHESDLPLLSLLHIDIRVKEIQLVLLSLKLLYIFLQLLRFLLYFSPNPFFQEFLHLLFLELKLPILQLFGERLFLLWVYGLRFLCDPETTLLLRFSLRHDLLFDDLLKLRYFSPRPECSHHSMLPRLKLLNLNLLSILIFVRDEELNFLYGELLILLYLNMLRHDGCHLEV